MPHYKDGTPAKEGDTVVIRFEVQTVYPAEAACNVALRAVDDVPGEYAPFLTLNSRFCEKVE